MTAKKKTITPKPSPEPQPERPSIPKGLLDAVMAIASQQSRVLEQMHAALVSGDDATALAKAREFCGLRSKSEGGLQ